ncbi:Ig-like domain-containing protein [Methanobrevibacter sp.]|uniref:Ig-like domain-containing protein n=1 Tax=Methanobrevibacter sp. TaxID=66852 RepID=UPI00388F22D8
MDKKIIIALIVIVLIALGGILAFSNGIKSDTQINFLSNSTLNNGDQIQFELKDAQGNVLANQEVTITFGANGENQNYTIVTDSEGKGGLLLENEEYGSYNITVTYAGDDKHNGCSASQTVTVGEVYSESTDSYSDTPSQSSSDTSSDSSSDLNYDSELNVYYDSDGKIVGGQNDGASYDYIKNNPPEVDEEGNLV